MTDAFTKNFRVKEFWVSATQPEVIKRGILDRPPYGIPNWGLPRLHLLCFSCLQPISDHYHRSVIITSGYRTRELNYLVNGYEHSDHIQCLASDFYMPSQSMNDVFDWIKDANLPYRQLIYYDKKNMIHISINAPLRIPFKHEAFNL